MSAQIGEFNGKPIISLKMNDVDKYPFSFGVKKATLILDHLDEIRAFVQEHQGQ